LPDIQPVAEALQALVLKRVQWQRRGTDPDVGLGCYGLVRYAFGMAGIELPCLAEIGEQHFAMVERPYQAFDVILSRFIHDADGRHVGILVAPDYGYHCSWMSNGVAQFRLTDRLWRRFARHGLRYKGFLTCD